MRHATPRHDRDARADSMQIMPCGSLPGNVQDALCRQVHSAVKNLNFWQSLTFFPFTSMLVSDDGKQPYSKAKHGIDAS